MFKKNTFGLILIAIIFILSACNNNNLPVVDIGGPSVDALELAAFVDGVMEDVLDENKDNYAAYFTEEEFAELYDHYQGSFGGIGVYMELLSKENPDDVIYPQIVGTMEGCPAKNAGVLPGDYIIAVDGKSTLDIDVSTVANWVKGEPGTTVVLCLKREDSEDIFIEITRAVIDSQSVYGQILPDTDGIAYIALSGFSIITAGEFADLYNSLNSEVEIKSLILDLRNNGGGAVEAATDMASYFVPANEVIFYQKKGGQTLQTNAAKTTKLNLPVVCLQNENSASASEMLIGALKDHEIAQTVGTLTFGKGITQIIFPLDSGAGLRYTESKYFTPNMFDLHGVGIEPQFEVENPDDFIPNVLNPDLENDKQLLKAIELLS